MGESECRLWPNASAAKESLFIAIQNEKDGRWLRAAQIEILDREECQKHFGERFNVTTRMLCAGGGEKDACSGDNGGPLVPKKSGKQVGLSTYSLDLCDKNNPGMYTNLANKEIHDFIDSELNRPPLIRSPNGSEV